MSDFDKIFREKMNEEESFPRMDRNWQRLSARLPVEPVAPKITWWQWAVAASVAALIGSNFWFWRELSQTKKDLEATKIAQNQIKPTSQSPIIVQRDTVYIEKKVHDNTPQNQYAQSPKKEVLLSQPIKQTMSDSKTPIAITPLKTDNKTQQNQKVTLPKVEDNKGLATVPTEQKTQTPTTANDVKKDNTAEPKSELTNNLDKNVVKPAETIAENQNTKGSEGAINNDNTPNTPSVSDIKKDKNEVAIVDKTIDNQQDTSAKVAEVEPKKDVKIDTLSSKPLIDAKPSEGVANAETQKDNDLEMKPIIPKIKWQPTVSMGVNGLIYAPTSSNLPDAKGIGGLLSLGVSDKFRVNVNYEKSTAEYKLKAPEPRFHHPKEPQRPLGNDVLLKEIEGEQKRTQLGLSINYFVTADKWINPYIELGYSIQHLASQKAKFEFLEKFTNTPITVIEISNPETFKNLWNIGIGAEKNIGRQWSLGVSANYQKDLSDTIADSFIFRGGIKYMF